MEKIYFKEIEKEFNQGEKDFMEMLIGKKQENFSDMQILKDFIYPLESFRGKGFLSLSGKREKANLIKKLYRLYNFLNAERNLKRAIQEIKNQGLNLSDLSLFLKAYYPKA